MKRFSTPFVLALAIGCFALSPATFAQDLSDDVLNPTVINLGLGSNVITQSVFESDLAVTGGTGDIDYFNIIVGAGQQLDSIDFLSSDVGVAFFGFQQGSQLSAQPAIGAEQAAFVANATGFTLVGNGNTVGEDLLVALAAGAGGSAPSNPINGPLAAGEYAFVLQNTGPDVQELSFDFVVSNAIPEPTSFALLGLAGIGMVSRRRRS